MLTCKEASKMVSQGLDRPLRWHERWSLRLHLWMCHSCRHFAAQMQLLRKAMQQWVASDDAAQATAQLSADARQRIQQRLRDAEPPSE